jgi:hypothetical protein
LEVEEKRSAEKRSEKKRIKDRRREYRSTTRQGFLFLFQETYLNTTHSNSREPSSRKNINFCKRTRKDG